MDFLTIFFDHNRAASSSGIRCEHDSIFELNADDGGACFFV